MLVWTEAVPAAFPTKWTTAFQELWKSFSRLFSQGLDGTVYPKNKVLVTDFTVRCFCTGCEKRTAVKSLTRQEQQPENQISNAAVIYTEVLFMGKKWRIHFLSWISPCFTLFPDLHISLQPLATTPAWCVRLVVVLGKITRPFLSNHKLLFCQELVEAPSTACPHQGEADLLPQYLQGCWDKCQGIQAADYCASCGERKLFIKIIDKAW